MQLEDLSQEVREKAMGCTTKEELMKVLASEGVELSLDQLDAISGGLWDVDCGIIGCTDV